MACYEEVNAVCEFLSQRVQIKPLVGLVCGSGLGKIAQRIGNSVVIPYKDIPGFPVTTVAGHAGNLVFGELGGKPVMLMQGRFHTYEGYTEKEVTMPIRVMKLMGCEYLIVTNATGGLHSNYDVGDLVVIKDHISIPALAGINPLNGPNDERFGPRFIALSDIYTKKLRKLTFRIAEEMGIDHLMHEGVYMCCCGPSFDTPAEARALRMLGADVLGMSLTAEAIVAHHAGMKVMALSLVTNRDVYEIDKEQPTNAEEVLATGLQRGDTMATLITRVIAAL